VIRTPGVSPGVIDFTCQLCHLQAGRMRSKMQAGRMRSKMQAGRTRSRSLLFRLYVVEFFELLRFFLAQ
jgi:hypothetical protein